MEKEAVSPCHDIITLIYLDSVDSHGCVNHNIINIVVDFCVVLSFSPPDICTARSSHNSIKVACIAFLFLCRASQKLLTSILGV